MNTRYAYCTSNFGWVGPHPYHHARKPDWAPLHRSPEAAGRYYGRMSKRIKKRYGATSYPEGRILATDDGGRNFRKLTEDENWAVHDAEMRERKPDFFKFG